MDWRGDAREHVPNAVAVEPKTPGPALEFKIGPGDAVGGCIAVIAGSSICAKGKHSATRTGKTGTVTVGP